MVTAYVLTQAAGWVADLKQGRLELILAGPLSWAALIWQRLLALTFGAAVITAGATCGLVIGPWPSARTLTRSVWSGCSPTSCSSPLSSARSPPWSSPGCAAQQGRRVGYLHGGLLPADIPRPAVRLARMGRPPVCVRRHRQPLPRDPRGRRNHLPRRLGEARQSAGRRRRRALPQDRVTMAEVPPSVERPRVGQGLRPRTGWCRPQCRPRPTSGSPSRRRRERDTSGIDALAWPAPTRVGHGTPPPRRTPRRQRLSRRSDRTASELGYVRGAGVAGAFGGDPTRCPGTRLDVAEALGWRRSRRMPVAGRGRRNQSEVSAPAMLRRTSAPQCRVCRRSRGSASSTIGDRAVHSCGCPVLWACRLICAVAPATVPVRRTGRLVWANAAVTASAVITDAIRWSQRFPPSCRIEIIWAPLYYRLLLHYAPLDEAHAAAVVDAALTGLAVRSD